MPHQCTNCGRTFPDGSKEMLSGCPDCDGNKFQFTPSGSGSGSGVGSAAAESSDAAAGSGSASSAADSDPAPESAPSAGSESDDESVTSRAAETVRDLMSPDSSSASDSSPAPNANAGTGTETDETPADRSWPTTATEDARGDATDAPDETAGFTEWPDTARRPEDRDGTGADTSPDAESGDSTPDRRKPTATLADSENTAQADARSDVVSSTELPSHTDQDDLRNRTASQPVDSSANAVESDTDSGTAATDESDAAGDAHAAAGSTSVSDSERDTDVDADAGSAVESAVNEPTAGDAVTDTDPAGDDHPPSHGRVVSEPSGDEPSIEELREELNKQFESIKIVNPGQYELNLMELYNREEYIISLQEDGRYVIDVPDSWREADE